MRFSFHGKLFWLPQTDLRAAVAVLCLWGVDLCCHCLCHCLCGQTLKLARSQLAEYYNTANASSDPWNLPSIEMNHTDGRFVIQQNCPSNRPAANISWYIWHCFRLRLNQLWALQEQIQSRGFSKLWRLHYLQQAFRPECVFQLLALSCTAST